MKRATKAWVVVGLALLALPAAAGQREPVLKQVKVPHHYYYREMYLPQVTGGPAAAAWSPDGKELVVSLQGALWRVALADGVARQLTDGPGYDHQPDWSPDGRFLAYASYRDDAVELWALELASGRSWPLTQGGAVNVEPRFSPDGRRLAYVSTAFEGRFHVFVMDLADGRPGAARRVTEDRDSGLPRYYYSRFDHYLSPAWSPDGGELLLVSNRGRVWGSGGFWRMRAEPSAPMREVHFEETTWRARPDWARDGKRVVYGSYSGRQWHQLWLTTANGGDAFPLTYGEFDATSPRWSPDGSRIAYVSNEGGPTSLWTISVPGGRRERVALREKRYLAPVGRLLLRTLDAATGQPVPARVSVTAADGRSFVPEDAWRHADDGFERGARRFEHAYFHADGGAELTLPAGRVEVEVTRGLEYRVERRTLELAAGEARPLEVSLARLLDLPARGVWSGDVHVHMNYGGAYRNDPARLAFQARAEDLHVVENVIVNKEQRVPDVAYFRPGPDPVSTADTLIAHGQEFHTSFWGHLGLLNLDDHLLLPDYSGYANTAAASLHPSNTSVAQLAHEQGALVGYVHPYDAPVDAFDRSQRLTHAFPVDAALGTVDYFETVGFSDDYFANSEVWYRVLNCGFRVPGAGGTDAMANYASLRGPVGMNRTYVRSGPRLDHATWLAGLKAGRSFATNGPLLDFTLAGKESGDEIALPAGRHTLEARVSVVSIVPVDRVEVVGNGAVVASVPVAGDGTRIEATLQLPVARSGWYVLRASAGGPRHPVLDRYPFATTSPIYVSVGGRPVRSPADAQFLGAWVERLTEEAQAHPDWNTEAEKALVLDQLARARAIYAERERP